MSNRAKFAQMKEKEKPEGTQSAGVGDFLKMVYDGQPEWAIMAVRAPVDEVSEDFADYVGSATVLRDVPRKPGQNYDDVDEKVAVVQPSGSAWTIIFRSVMYIDEDMIETVAEEAREMSARLNTQALSFIGEDTSGGNGYKLFEKGKLMEDIEWEDGGTFFKWKSSVRKRPQLEQVDDKFIDEIFREHGIYVPACYAMADETNSWLAGEKASLDAIERADLIEFEESDEDEEEDEDDEE